MSGDRWVRRMEQGMVRVERAWRSMRRRELDRRAVRHRAALTDTLFIGVTGSGGKTTAKELIAAVLSTRFAGSATLASHNAHEWLPKTVLAARPGDGFCVVELGAFGPGTLDYGIDLLRPTIGVVTTVGQDHRSQFRTLEATAQEKGKLVAALPPDGTAVLNADDPFVARMAARCAGRVVTYGLSADAMLRGTDVSAVWPERMSLRAHWGEETVEVRTQLCGVHWATVVLGALAAGVVMGVPLPEAAEAIRGVTPVVGRMFPVSARGGVTFIRDDDKAPFWSLGSALEFMRTARATRRIVVLGTIADLGKHVRKGYQAAARESLAAAERVLFVGMQSHHALGAAPPGRSDDLLAFETVQDASRFLDGFLREGDLVLLKGSNTADHLGRLALARTSGVSCWRARCGKHRYCEDCFLRHVPLGRGSADPPAWGRRGASA